MTAELERTIDLLVAQRDEHVSRFHSVNGQFAIGLLTFSATVVFSAASGAKEISRIAVAPCCVIAFALLGRALLFASAVLVAAALYNHSVERGNRIRTLARAIRALSDPRFTEAPSARDLALAMSSWVNPCAFNSLVFAASTLIVLGAVLIGLAIVLAQ